MDESGAMEEYWIVGEDSNAHWEKKLTAVPDGTFRIMGFLEEGKDITDVENPSLGDVYFLRQSVGSDDDNFKEYIWLGDSWEMLGQAQLNISMSTLTVKLPDSTSKTYNGTSAVTIDLSGVATQKEVDALDSKIYEKLSKTDVLSKDDGVWYGALFRYGMEDGTGANGIIHYYGIDGTPVMTSMRLNMNDFEFGQFKVNGSGLEMKSGYNTFKVNGRDALLKRDASSEYYQRLNPIILVVNVFYHPNVNQWCNVLYNPYNLKVLCQRTSTGRYLFTHGLKDAGLCTGSITDSQGDPLDTTDFDFYTSVEAERPYVVVGNASSGKFNSRSFLYFSPEQMDENSFTFGTADDASSNDFQRCSIMIYDFSRFKV